MRLAPKFSTKLASPSIHIDESRATITGETGYRSAIATSQREPPYVYFEAQIENDEGYARIGVATTECDLSGPVGMDEFGYSYGNRNGYGFHRGRRIRMGERFGRGDILSVYLRRTRRGLSLHFFLNGLKTYSGFEGIADGHYWPAASSYGPCRISFNFGPYFAYENKIQMEMEKEVEEKPRGRFRQRG